MIVFDREWSNWFDKKNVHIRKYFQQSESIWPLQCTCMYLENNVSGCWMQAAEASVWASGNSVPGSQLDGSKPGPQRWLHTSWGRSVALEFFFYRLARLLLLTILTVWHILLVVCPSHFMKVAEQSISWRYTNAVVLFLWYFTCFTLPSGHMSPIDDIRRSGHQVCLLHIPLSQRGAVIS